MKFVALIIALLCAHVEAKAGDCPLSVPGPGVQYFMRDVGKRKPVPVCSVHDGGDADAACARLQTETISLDQLIPKDIDAKIGGSFKGTVLDCPKSTLADMQLCLQQQMDYAQAELDHIRFPIKEVDDYFESEYKKVHGVGHFRRQVPAAEHLAYDPAFSDIGGVYETPDNWAARSEAAYNLRINNLLAECKTNGVDCSELEEMRYRIPAMIKHGKDVYIGWLAWKKLRSILPTAAEFRMPDNFDRYRCINQRIEASNKRIEEERAKKAKSADAKKVVGKKIGSVNLDAGKGHSDAKPKPKPKPQKKDAVAVGPVTKPEQIDPVQVGPVTKPDKGSGSYAGTDPNGGGSLTLTVDDGKVGHPDGDEKGHGTNPNGNTLKDKNTFFQGKAASQNMLDYAPNGKGRLTNADNTRPIFQPQSSGGWGLTSKEAPHCSEFMGKHNFMCLGTGLEDDLITIGKNKALMEEFCQAEVKKFLPMKEIDDCGKLDLPMFSDNVKKNCKAIKQLLPELEKRHANRAPLDAACQLWFKQINGLKDTPNFGDRDTLSAAYRDGGVLGNMLNHMADYVETGLHGERGARRNLGAYSVMKQAQFLYGISVNVSPSNIENHKAFADSLVGTSASCLSPDEKNKVRENIATASAALAEKKAFLEQTQGTWVNSLISAANTYQRAQARMDAIEKIKKQNHCGRDGTLKENLNEQNQISCGSLQKSLDEATSARDAIANDYPLLQQNVTIVLDKSDPNYVHVENQVRSSASVEPTMSDPANVAKVAAKVNTREGELWKWLSNSTITPDEALRYCRLAAKDVMKAGFKRLEDICKEGLGAEGRRAADMYPLVEGYLSCDDLKESESATCDNRAVGAWSLCRTQADTRLKEERKAMWNFVKTMVMAGAMAVAIAATAGGATVFAAVIGIGTSTYGVTTGIQNYVNHDEAKMVREATVDFNNKFTDFESFKRAVDVAQDGPTLAGTVFWSTLDVAFAGLGALHVAKAIADTAKAARVMKLIEAAREIKDPVAQMAFLDKLRQGQVTALGANNERIVVETLTEQETRAVSKSIDKQLADDFAKNGGGNHNAPKQTAAAPEAKPNSPNKFPRAKAEKAGIPVQEASAPTMSDLKPVKGKPPKLIFVKGDGAWTVRGVDEATDTVIISNGKTTRRIPRSSLKPRSASAPIGVAKKGKGALIEVAPDDGVIPLDEGDYEIIGDLKDLSDPGMKIPGTAPANDNAIPLADSDVDIIGDTKDLSNPEIKVPPAEAPAPKPAQAQPVKMEAVPNGDGTYTMVENGKPSGGSTNGGAGEPHKAHPNTVPRKQPTPPKVEAKAPAPDPSRAKTVAGNVDPKAPAPEDLEVEVEVVPDGQANTAKPADAPSKPNVTKNTVPRKQPATVVADSGPPKSGIVDPWADEKTVVGQANPDGEVTKVVPAQKDAPVGQQRARHPNTVDRNAPKTTKPAQPAAPKKDPAPWDKETTQVRPADPADVKASTTGEVASDTEKTQVFPKQQEAPPAQPRARHPHTVDRNAPKTTKPAGHRTTSSSANTDATVSKPIDPADAKASATGNVAGEDDVTKVRNSENNDPTRQGPRPTTKNTIPRKPTRPPTAEGVADPAPTPKEMPEGVMNVDGKPTVLMSGAKRVEVVDYNKSTGMLTLSDGREVPLENFKKMGGQLVEDTSQASKAAGTGAGQPDPKVGANSEGSGRNPKPTEPPPNRQGKVNVPKKKSRFEDRWDKLENPKWKEKVSDLADTRENYLYNDIPTKNGTTADTGELVAMEDGTQARIKNARHDPATGKNWVELSNGEVVDASSVTPVGNGGPTITDADVGQGVLFRDPTGGNNPVRKIIQSVDEEHGLVKFKDDPQQYPVSKFGRTGGAKGKFRPFVELPMPPAVR